MNNDLQSLDELLECAIREKGAIAHMEELDRKGKTVHHHWLHTFAYGAAACIAIAACTDLKLSSDARKAGYGFDPTYGQAGGSEITALMQERKINEAIRQIDLAYDKVNAEIESPSSSDPEYIQQLNSDLQELDLLEAVCMMRKGQYFKSRKALKAIASSGGAFADEANKLLNDL